MNDCFFYNPPLDPYLDIIYEDNEIMVVNKPSGILSVKGRLPKHFDSVLLRIQNKYPDAQAVHRLDLDTSGLMVVALNKNSTSSLGKQFNNKTVEKNYVAKVLGKLTPKEQIISAPLRCDWENRPLQIIDPVMGKKSTTKVSLIHYDGKYSYVALLPVTGRSHQLRVHLKSIGHPILGDRFYGGTEAFQAYHRLCLHACYLSFYHPTTKEKMAFKSFPEFFDICKDIPLPYPFVI